MESASDRGPGSMSGTPGELPPASVTGRLAGCALWTARWLPAAAVIALTLVAFVPVPGDWFIPNWDDRTSLLLHTATALGVYFLAVRDLATRSAPAARLLTTCTGPR